MRKLLALLLILSCTLTLFGCGIRWTAVPLAEAAPPYAHASILALTELRES